MEITAITCGRRFSGELLRCLSRPKLHPQRSVMQPETEKPPGGGFGCVSASRPGTFSRCIAIQLGWPLCTASGVAYGADSNLRPNGLATQAISSAFALATVDFSMAGYCQIVVDMSLAAAGAFELYGGVRSRVWHSSRRT